MAAGDLVACVECGADEVGLVKRPDGWVCDLCDELRQAYADLDLEEHEETRRLRLAELAEY